MLSRGHTTAGPDPGLPFEVPIETAPARPYEPDEPYAFPPGSSGSAMPLPVPENILALLKDIDQGHVLAWQPVLSRVVLWKSRQRRFGGNEDAASLRMELRCCQYSDEEIDTVVDPLIRADQSGWTCCFVLQNSYGYPWAGLMPAQPVPLDNRFLAMLYDSDPASYGGIKAMREAVKEQHNQDVKDRESNKADLFTEQFDAARTLTRISNIAPGNRSMLQNRPDLVARANEFPDI